MVMTLSMTNNDGQTITIPPSRKLKGPTPSVVESIFRPVAGRRAQVRNCPRPMKLNKDMNSLNNYHNFH